MPVGWQGFAAVVALTMGLSNRGVETTTGGEQGRTTTPANASPVIQDSSSPSRPCKEIQDHLERFATIEKDSQRLPGGACYKPTRKDVHQPRPAQVWDGVQFAIAIVPNPVSTHLQLMFDGIVDTIQRAAQDDGYTYDSAWFPWQEEREKYTRLRDQVDADEVKQAKNPSPG